MDDHLNRTTTTSSFSWPPCFLNDQLQLQQEESSLQVENLKQALLRTTLELESTRVIAQEELKKLESQSLHLALLLQVATRERDDARNHCHQLSLLLLQQSQTHNSHSPAAAPNLALAAMSSSSSSEVEVDEEVEVNAVRKRGLPEKGRLVEAVMRAGPLLKTLMLAGPLPEWRHPPPAMKGFEIPPVEMMSGGDEKKRKKRGRGRDEEKVLVVSLGSSPETESNHSSTSSKQLIGSFRL